jgi:hypothetical protein
MAAEITATNIRNTDTVAITYVAPSSFDSGA